MDVELGMVILLCTQTYIHGAERGRPLSSFFLLRDVVAPVICVADGLFMQKV